MRCTKANIYCLVRNTSITTPTALCDQLNKQFGTFFDKDVTDEDDKRIIIIHGDVSLHQHGLNNDTWSKLIEDIDMIVHCGAAVSIESWL